MLNLNNALIFGQRDYTERLQCYLKKISPYEKIQILSFYLKSNHSTEYIYDYSRFNKELNEIDKDSKIIVAFESKYQKDATQYLKKFGFNNIQIYNAEMDNELKREFFKKQFREEGKEFSFIENEKSVLVYMAKNIIDKPLNNYPQNLSKHIIPIQAGAALTNKKIADITDNTGDNISERNNHFSEATVLYWMWKNANADYLGLCHYRRLWKNLNFIAGKLQNNNIDIVLPVPTLCVHSVMKNYMERYIPDVYPIMLEVLKEMSPEYFEASEKIYRGHIFYACNMLIAKKKVLNKLCEWMFPMVFEIENQVGNLPDPYKNRYAGFCTEILMALYFLYNKENLKISHADKIFIE